MTRAKRQIHLRIPEARSDEPVDASRGVTGIRRGDFVAGIVF